MRRLSLTSSFPSLSLAIIIASILPARAEDKPGAKDFPSISRFRGAEIVDYHVSEFDEAVLPIRPIDSVTPYPVSELKTVEGKITRIRYQIAGTRTGLEVMRSYEQALSSSYRTLFKCAGMACGRELSSFLSGKVVPNWSMTFNSEKNRYLLVQRKASEGDVYVLIYVMDEGNSGPILAYEEVVEVKAMAEGQVTVLDASALKHELDTEGKVAIYGVYFDTAKSEIKPASKASLDEMAKLLSDNPKLRVYIVGHTDNAGAFAQNLELSQHRADAVAKALASAYKIEANRLTARGVASLAPVSTNSNEAGRSRNRRVELVVQ